jgi:hypothetical protein
MKYLFAALSIFSLPAHADFNGMLAINSANTQAKLVMNEEKVDGDLSRLFDKMGGTETSQGQTKSKTFALSNNRFSFTCKKSFLNPNPPATSCTMTILAGENSGDINTFISKSADRNVAVLGMNPTFGKELQRVFPEDSSGMVDFFIKTDNGVGLEVKGASWGNMTIGFSSN